MFEEEAAKYDGNGTAHGYCEEQNQDQHRTD